MMVSMFCHLKNLLKYELFANLFSICRLGSGALLPRHLLALLTGNVLALLAGYIGTLFIDLPLIYAQKGIIICVHSRNRVLKKNKAER